MVLEASGPPQRLLISGVTGAAADDVNGTYVLLPERNGGRPRWRRESGGETTCLFYTRHRWVVASEAHRRPFGGWDCMWSVETIAMTPLEPAAKGAFWCQARGFASKVYPVPELRIAALPGPALAVAAGEASPAGAATAAPTEVVVAIAPDTSRRVLLDGWCCSGLQVLITHPPWVRRGQATAAAASAPSGSQRADAQCGCEGPPAPSEATLAAVVPPAVPATFPAPLAAETAAAAAAREEALRCRCAVLEAAVLRRQAELEAYIEDACATPTGAVQPPVVVPLLAAAPEAPTEPTPIAPGAACCVIWQDADVNTCLVPCGHLCACSDCAKQLRGTCPICRGRVKKVVRTYAP